jgi:hypothetical protein
MARVGSVAAGDRRTEAGAGSAAVGVVRLGMRMGGVGDRCGREVDRLRRVAADVESLEADDGNRTRLVKPMPVAVDRRGWRRGRLAVSRGGGRGLAGGLRTSR